MPVWSTAVVLGCTAVFVFLANYLITTQTTFLLAHSTTKQQPSWGLTVVPFHRKKEWISLSRAMQPGLRSAIFGWENRFFLTKDKRVYSQKSSVKFWAQSLSRILILFGVCLGETKEIDVKKHFMIMLQKDISIIVSIPKCLGVAYRTKTSGAACSIPTAK